MKLSERHRQILELIAQGLSDREIGARLYISIHTAKSNAGDLLKVLGARNRTHAVTRGHELGLLGPVAELALTDPGWLDIESATSRVLALENDEAGYRERAAFERCRALVVAELARHALIRVSDLDRAVA